ncbi:MAG: EscU/YscU/HrcU family type III secretion system export apparatus switch protein, partial [Pseudomonadota bacterium]
MSEQDEGQEKSFEATPEKLKKARKKGNVAVSTDVAVFASYLGVLIGLFLAGGAIFHLGEGLGAFLWH